MSLINIHTIFLKTGIPISGTTLVYGHFQQIKGASNDLTPTIVNIDVMTVIIALMTGPHQPAANQRGKYTPSFPAARMWRGSGTGAGAGLPPNLELGH